MTTGELIQVILMGLLVLVTGIYAWRTFSISKATEKQAEASVIMARETRDKRYSESLPLLVPTIPPILNTDELPYESLQSGMGVKVLWRNVGKGVAINSRFSFYPVPTSSGKAASFPYHGLGTLEVGGKKEVDFDKIFEHYWQETKLLNDKRWHQVSDEYQPRLEAEYQDIYERSITTVQEFHFDAQKKTVSLGDLYFTVNGRRLGEERARYD